MSVFSLLTILPADRTKLGTLELLGPGGITLAGPFWIYGKADGGTAIKKNNPNRARTKLYGDTPTGGFAVTGREPSGPGTAHPDISKYGPNGVLRLDPQVGEAMLAKANGRTGLLIHGGALAPTPGGRFLRPTNGCIRMLDSDVRDLMARLAANNVTFPFDLSVREGVPTGLPILLAGPDEGYEDQDPPQ